MSFDSHEDWLAEKAYENAVAYRKAKTKILEDALKLIIDKDNWGCDLSPPGPFYWIARNALEEYNKC